MAYNEVLADRLRKVLIGEPGITAKKMFGGLAFMVNGNMACGIVGDDLMLRLGTARHDEALSRPFARPMDFAGRPMVGMIYVAPPGYESDKDLAGWVALALDFVRSLPAKKPTPGKKR